MTILAPESETAPGPSGGTHHRSTSAPSTIGGPMGAARFAWSLGGIVVAALAIRVTYVLMVTRHEHGKLYDAFWYGVTSGELSKGEFFREPFGFAPTAAHPPLTSLLIGVPGVLSSSFEDGASQRITMSVLGAGVVLCVGLLGRSVAGPWIGLVAAGLAAVAPNFWLPSGIIMSETPSMLFMALMLLAVIRLWRSPTMWHAVLVGAA